LQFARNIIVTMLRGDNLRMLLSSRVISTPLTWCDATRSRRFEITRLS